MIYSLDMTDHEIEAQEQQLRDEKLEALNEIMASAELDAEGKCSMTLLSAITEQDGELVELAKVNVAFDKESINACSFHEVCILAQQALDLRNAMVSELVEHYDLEKIAKEHAR